MTPSRRRLALVLGLAAVALAYLAISVGISDRALDDDAFISFRYARNLLGGHGLVYNPGEYVEGYTNFSWTLLIAGTMALGADPVAAAQVLGMLLGVASLILLARLALRWGVPATWAVAGALCLTLILPFAIEGVLGLETPLYVFLSLGSLALWESRDERAGSSLGCGAIFALTAMTRPEGVALFALSFAVEAWPRPWPWRRWLLRTAGFVAIFGPFLAWRVMTYGELVPNTFYAKTGGGSWLWMLGAEYVGGALLRLGPMVLALPLVLWPRVRNELPGGALLCAAWVGLMLPYLISVGGDFRPHYRFIVPLLPWTLLLFLATLRTLPGRRGVARAALVFLAWPALGFFGPATEWLDYRAVRNPQLEAVGTFMKEYAEPGSLLAISGGGVIPYLSELPAIEMWGLTDKTIAHAEPRRIGRGLPGHLKGDGDYILRREPRYVLFIGLMWTRRPPLHREVGARVASPSELDLWRSPEFQRRYRMRSFRLPGGGVTTLFERR